MSGADEAAAAAPEEDVASPPKEPMGCLTRIIPVSTPGCASALTLVFLLTTVLSVWIVFWLDPVNIPWRHGYSWLRIVAILGLMGVIPWVVYKTIQSWLEGPHRAFPELDIAWQAGINALAANELAPSNVPLFLIVGTSGEAQERAMMDATGMSFSVEGVPHGPAPIHWYANAEAIYLFCSDASWVSSLASLREELSSEQSPLSMDTYYLPSDIANAMVPTPGSWSSSGGGVSSAPSFNQPAFPNSNTPNASSFGNSFNAPQPSALPPSPNFSGSSGGRIKGTLELDNFMDQNRNQEAPPPPAFAAPPSNTPYRGTLILDSQGSGDTGISAPRQPMSPFGSPAASSFGGSANTNRSNSTLQGYTLGAEPVESQANRKPILVSHQYSSACLQELAYLGSLVRKSRQPLCSINGILTVLQMESIHGTPAEIEELTKAIRSDLETIQYSFQIRCPVTAMVVGLERERGFRELVRRVGKDRALSQRFGKRFDVNAIPTRSELASLATLACSAFEDWTYSLFREEQALTKPGNTRLYELLSKVRCNWKSRLSTILSQGFGCDENGKGDPNAILFSGCYFAGTGETPDRQAFVKGIVEKLNEEQEFIEWTPAALRSHKLQSTIASVGIVVVLALLALLLIMFVSYNTGTL